MTDRGVANDLEMTLTYSKRTLAPRSRFGTAAFTVGIWS